MTRARNSWQPIHCAVLTNVAIVMGMMLDGIFDLVAAALLMYPIALLTIALYRGSKASE